MADPYTPTLDSLAFTAAEKSAVKAALLTTKPWDWEPGGAEGASVASVKAKIRDLHMARHGSRCCYCRKNLHGGGPFTIDREHVLPKSRPAFKLLTFEIWNLGIACKRCNMQYKKNKIDFVAHPDDQAALQTSVNYLFIHPNFDLYKDHIGISAIQNDDITIVKYTRHGTPKGAFTYEYFKLDELEVGSFDAAQGAQQLTGLEGGALEARSLAREHHQ